MTGTRIDEAVLCILLSNTSGKGLGEGFIIGRHCIETDASAESDISIRSIHYEDSSYYVNDNGAITIYASKALTLTASSIDINH